MSEQYGTEMIEKVLYLLGDVVMDAEKAKADDGEIDWSERAGIIAGALPEAITILVNNKTLVQQLKDWSPEERRANLEGFKTRFNLTDDEVEEVVEFILTGLVYLTEGIQRLVQKDEEEAEEEPQADDE